MPRSKKTNKTTLGSEGRSALKKRFDRADIVRDVRCGFVVEHRVSPPAAFRKSLAVLFDDESLGKDVWHIHDEGGLCALLRLPLELHDHGAIRERLAAARNAGFVRLDHRRIGDDHLAHLV